MVLISNLETARVFVKDQSYIGAARRSLRQFAEGIGLQGEPLEKLSVIVSELASNLAKHSSHGGEILACDTSCADTRSLRITSVDRGPGMENISKCLLDGVSNTQTLGAGLGALQRLSDSFEISSTAAAGTVVVCTVSQSGMQSPARRRECLNVGYVSVAHPNELSNGDAVAVALSDELASLLVVDGSGHGPDAAIVAETAARSFHEAPFADGPAIVKRIHQELRGSRGAALALIQIHPDKSKLSFVGVGNISGRIYMKYSTRGCASIQGIVGAQLGNLKEFIYDWQAQATLLLHTDGIKSSACLESNSPKSPELLAAEIYRDHSRLNDDATVVVVKDNRS